MRSTYVVLHKIGLALFAAFTLVGCDPSLIGTDSLVSLAPAQPGVTVFNQIQMKASGGIPPYKYVILSGTGSVDETNGVYRAPASAGSVTIQVTDSESKSAQAVVPVFAAVAITPATPAL